MDIQWTLNKKQVSGLAVYSSILPTALVLHPFVGEWMLLIGGLISLPLAPVGFMAFWMGIHSGNTVAFALTWLVNFLQGWLMLASYVARRKQQTIRPTPIKRFTVPIFCAAIVIFIVVMIFDSLPQ